MYLDVEGLPDRDFYYLIGVRVKTGESVVQHNLWADSVSQEKQIWTDFLNILAEVKSPVLIHYGSFETIFMKRMSERYGEPSECSAPATAIKSAINLLSLIYARIYFPTFSNGLKEVAGHLGFRWSESMASGLQSIAWRHEWAAFNDPAIEQSLITYNTNDCEALELVTSKLIALQKSILNGESEKQTDFVDTASLKRVHPHGFKRNTFVFPELDAINKAAYWDYQRERIYVKSNIQVKRSLRRASKARKVSTPNKVIECPPPGSCPKCDSPTLSKRGKASKTVLDLKFMRHGLKRWITRYQFHRYECKACGAVFYPPEKPWTRSIFGSEIAAYALYQNIGLRLPQENVDRSMSRLFGVPLALGRTNEFKTKAAQSYKKTYDALVERVCRGQLVHVDETKISVRGRDGVVWVFANMEEVAYVYSESREGDTLHTLLNEFTGVLVSDFYAAYDGIPCPQQKCLIHLIRDLNDEVLKHPYDEELKHLVKGFADLVRPMVESVDRYGLKSRFLRRHILSVERFYKHLSMMTPRSEPATKCKQRFEKNRDTLFTFLKYDGVPWNNNNAEHAVKAFATLRRVIKGVTTEKGLRDYLVLLSLCETCKYKGVDFLDFLRSGEKDIGVFFARK